MNMEKVTQQRFDIMLGGDWKGQIAIPVCEIFEYEESYFRKYVEERRPSLAGKAFTLAPTSNKVFK